MHKNLHMQSYCSLQIGSRRQWKKKKGKKPPHLNNLFVLLNFNWFLDCEDVNFVMLNDMGKQLCTEQARTAVTWREEFQLDKEATRSSFPAGKWIQHEHWSDGRADINLYCLLYFIPSLVSSRERVLRESLQPPSVHDLQRGLEVQQPCITKWVPLSHSTPPASRSFCLSLCFLFFVLFGLFVCLFVLKRGFKYLGRWEAFFLTLQSSLTQVYTSCIFCTSSEVDSSFMRQFRTWVLALASPWAASTVISTSYIKS